MKNLVVFDSRSVGIVVLAFASLLGSLFLFLSLAGQIIAGVVLSLLLYQVHIVFHFHCHRAVFSSRLANRGFEMVIGVLTFQGRSQWVLLPFITLAYGISAQALLCIILPAWIISRSAFRYTNYLLEKDCEGDHSYQRANTFHHPVFNFLFMNYGYQTVHREFPALHWSRLANAHSDCENLIPSELKYKSIYEFVFRPERPAETAFKLFLITNK